MKIRRFRQQDARRCYFMIKRCILAHMMDEESAHTLNQLIEGNKPKNLIAKSKKRYYYVAEEHGRIVGIGGYCDERHLHTFFVDIDKHRKGIARSILDRIIKDARKRGFSKIFTNSSLYAEGFYRRCGFRRIRKTTVPWRGDTITFIEMERKI